MAEQLQTPDGKPVELPSQVEEAQREFAAAMAADSPAETPAPPKRPESDSKPAGKRRGRPPKSERSRTSAAASEPSEGNSAEVVKSDYSADAQALVATTWAVTAAIPYTQAYAFVLNKNADQLTAALAEGAKHNPTIRRVVSGGGANSWMLQLGAVGMQMGMDVMQIMRDPEVRAACAEATRDQLKATLKAQGIEIPEKTVVNQPEPG